MACRYLDQQGNVRICAACQPRRAPSWAELQGHCQTESQAGCRFYRFARATGRALRQDDDQHWSARAQRASMMA